MTKLARRAAESWLTFKFLPELKQPYVLRPSRAPLVVKGLLLAIKAISAIPTSWLRRFLSVDFNERVVEYAFAVQCLGDVRGKRILDFGCTESVLPISLATLGADVVGVDLRRYDLEHPGFRFEEGDFLQVKLPDSSFDAVVAISAVEHVGIGGYGEQTGAADADLAVVRQFRRVLRAGGVLCLTVPFGKSRVDDLQRIYDGQRLRLLLAGFEVQEKRFFKKAADATHWYEAAEEEAAQAGYDSVTGVQAVALVAARSPR